MNDPNVPRNTCSGCGCPEQLAGLPCGFCREDIPFPTGALTDKGALTVKKIMAWKGMHITWKTGVPLLIPPVYAQDGPWLPGEWQVATCGGRKPDEKHLDPTTGEYVSPRKECTCGFYSGRTREHQMALGYSHYSEAHPAVMVEIQLAGKIFPASNGFRAQKARPVRIHVPHELWELGRDLKAAYAGHAEVVMETTIILPKDATPERCPKCTALWEGRGTSCSFCSYTLGG